MSKKLWITVDYPDDLLKAGRHFTQSDLDGMMRYAAAVGAERVQWIFEPMYMLYDPDAPGGFDLLAGACEAAHRHGLRFIAIFKPFEGAMEGLKLLPHGLPVPDDAPLLNEMSGLVHAYRPEIAEHYDKQLARLADDAVDPGGRIAAVRLVKHDDAPEPFGPADLSLWTSSRNGGYARYTGPCTFESGTAWRMHYPYADRPYRIVTLGGLQLPEDARYLMIRRGAGVGDFTNAVETLVELVNENGVPIPSTPGGALLDGAKHFEFFKRQVNLGLSAFARRPEARALLRDRDGFIALCEGMRPFNAGWENRSLDPGGEFAVARGRERYRTGMLHPVYPEVRAKWLDYIRFCIARGVDGVNIRLANHNCRSEPRFYGFNPPAVAQTAHPGNIAEIRRANGEAFTQFLREARECLHASDRELGVHVHGLLLRFDDKSPNNHRAPLNFEWQWERWIREIVDFVEYRGAFFFRPENQRYLTDRIGLAAREAGIPFVYQSLRGPMMHFDGPHHALAHEMDGLRHHPDVSVYNLYEMASFSRINPETGFEGSPDMAELVKSHWLRPTPPETA